MVKVTWQPGRTPRELRAEEAVLGAAEKGDVVLETTRLVLNCPIVQRDRQGGPPGLALPRTVRSRSRDDFRGQHWDVDRRGNRQQ